MNVVTCPDTCHCIGRSTHKPVIKSIVGSTCFADNIPAGNGCTPAQSRCARINNVMQKSVHNSGSFGRDNMVCTTSVTVIKNDISVMVCYIVECIRLIAVTTVTEYLIACCHFLYGSTAMKTAYGKTGFIIAVFFGVKVSEVKFLCKEVIACIKTDFFQHGNGCRIGR